MSHRKAGLTRRLRIAEALRQSPQTSRDLSRALGIERATVTQEIRQMIYEGVVESRGRVSTKTNRANVWALTTARLER